VLRLVPWSTAVSSRPGADDDVLAPVAVTLHDAVYDEVAPGLRAVVRNSTVPTPDDLGDVLPQPEVIPAVVANAERRFPRGEKTSHFVPFRSS